MALGDSLASNFHASEALQWYQRAAAQGNIEGEYHASKENTTLGKCCCSGGPASPPV
ncbi:hypothetical protein SBV1_2260002 [Verrucomicrobia bacterium]|nr:hypothetical protein SBV1_2260002 [Verrucomicrobiota bacterium]